MRSAGRVAALAGAVVASVVLALPTLAQAGGGTDEPTGLWPGTFSADQVPDDCGQWRLNDDAFCVANDSRNGLEVGVKFQTSHEVLVTGVRIYRVDTDTVTASLWGSDGTRLAEGDFSPGAGAGWQDMAFAQPVTIVPGTTYVASYFTPRSKYAFSYRYFADSGRTVGPITALRSEADSPNGVHCYEDSTCGRFPVRGYRSSNYWVTPLWRALPDSGPSPTPTATPTTTPTTGPKAPRVISASPARGAHGVRIGKKVEVRFSEPLRRASLTSSSVRLLRRQGSRPVAATLTYRKGSRRVILDPLARLHRARSFRVVVTTSVRDVAGDRLDQNPTKAGRQAARWTFRTR
jgi:hypothetical protein